MDLKKTTILSALSTIIKLASSLVINKVIAVFVGPAGVALIGQFQKFLGIVRTIGNGAINSGVTKYVAEYNETDHHKRNDIISAAFITSIVFSLVIGVIIFWGSAFFSVWILKTAEYDIVFRVLGITLIFTSLNTVLLSIINGVKKIKLFITINILSSLLSLVITSLLTIQYRLYGALLAMVIVQAIIFLVTFPISLKKLSFPFKFNKRVDKTSYRKLLSFTIMAIVSMMSVQ